MLLGLRNILQKFITKIDSVLDHGLVWGCTQSLFKSKRCKKVWDLIFYTIQHAKDCNFYQKFFFPFPKPFCASSSNEQTERLDGSSPLYNLSTRQMYAGYNVETQCTRVCTIYRSETRVSLLRTIWASSWFSGWGGWCPFPAMIGVNVWLKYNLFFLQIWTKFDSFFVPVIRSAL